MLISIVNIASALCGLISAGLWLWAARLRPVLPLAYLGGPPASEIKRLNLQSQLNAWAAGLTGVAILLSQVCSPILMHFLSM